MVKGIEKFKEAFQDFAEDYVIIGGAACSVILDNTFMSPRKTVDIDMIVIVENVSKEFGLAFWKFIKDGQYQAGKRLTKEGKQTTAFYRFNKPQAGYPYQIELFSIHSDALGEPSGFHIEPLPIDEAVSSLSAIMMDEDYYHITVANSTIEDGLRIASPVSLICLKAKAYMNLTQNKLDGIQVDSRDIKKHKTDILKLIAAAPIPQPIALPKDVYATVMQFAQDVEAELPNQALQDALGRPAKDIELYVKALKDTFIQEL